MIESDPVWKGQRDAGRGTGRVANTVQFMYLFERPSSALLMMLDLLCCRVPCCILPLYFGPSRVSSFPAHSWDLGPWHHCHLFAAIVKRWVQKLPQRCLPRRHPHSLGRKSPPSNLIIATFLPQS